LGSGERAALRATIRAAAEGAAASAETVPLLERLHDKLESEADDMPRSVETMLFLQRAYLFAELTPGQLGELAAVAAWETLAPGDGIEPEGLVLVASGRRGEAGEHGRGAVLGVAALLGDPISQARVATERARILRLSRHDFERVVE